MSKQKDYDKGLVLRSAVLLAWATSPLFLRTSRFEYSWIEALGFAIMFAAIEWSVRRWPWRPE